MCLADWSSQWWIRAQEGWCSNEWKATLIAHSARTESQWHRFNAPALIIHLLLCLLSGRARYLDRIISHLYNSASLQIDSTRASLLIVNAVISKMRRSRAPPLTVLRFTLKNSLIYLQKAHRNRAHCLIQTRPSKLSTWLSVWRAKKTPSIPPSDLARGSRSNTPMNNLWDRSESHLRYQCLPLISRVNIQRLSHHTDAVNLRGLTVTRSIWSSTLRNKRERVRVG